MTSARHDPPGGCEISVRQLDDGLTLRELFGNAHPLEIEIGSGRGRFLLQAAQDNPQVNYVGIERANKFFQYTRERVEAAGLGNVRLIRAEADYFLWGYVQPGSIRAFHIYFPDPWPKQRHRRRRLLNAEFFARLRDRLEPGGAIHLATDVREYFDVMLRAGRQCEGLAETTCRAVDPAGADPESAATHYERRFYLHGVTIYRASFARQGG